MLALRQHTSQELFTIRCIHQWVRTHFDTEHLEVPVNLHKLWTSHSRVIADPDIPLSLKALSALTPHCDFIVLNTQYGPFSQRFSWAHELIHLNKHRRHVVGVGSAVHYVAHPYHGLMELEANAGAAELLLPYPWLMDTASQWLGPQGLADPHDLNDFLASAEARRWSGQARVSLQVLGYHLVDLGLVGHGSRIAAAQLVLP